MTTTKRKNRDKNGEPALTVAYIRKQVEPFPYLAVRSRRGYHDIYNTLLAHHSDPRIRAASKASVSTRCMFSSDMPRDTRQDVRRLVSELVMSKYDLKAYCDQKIAEHMDAMVQAAENVRYRLDEGLDILKRAQEYNRARTGLDYMRRLRQYAIDGMMPKRTYALDDDPVEV